MGLIVLIGWARHIPAFTQILPGLSAMNPMTAVVIIVTATSAALHDRLDRRALLAVSIFIAGIGLAKLLQLAGASSFAVDQLLFADRLNDAVGVPPNRMAPNTALCLMLMATAIATSKTSSARAVFVSQAFCCSIIAITLFALTGYTLGLVGLYGIQSFNPMAVHTAFALLMIASAILTANPQVGIMRLVSDQGPAGQLARRLMPLVVFVPVAVELLRLEGEKAGLYGANTGVAVQVFANVVVTFSLLMMSIVSLYQSDLARCIRERAVRRSDEEFRLAEELCHVGHWRLDLSSNVFQCSPELVSMCGLPADTQPTIEELLALYSPDDAAGQREIHKHALSVGSGWDQKRRITRPDGASRIIRSFGKVEKNEQGETTSLFGVFADITDLEGARQKAESATMAKAAFLANMSHEIRTPLNAIIGFTDLILEDPELQETHRKQLRLVKNSGGALLTVVNDILDFSKMEAGKVELLPRPFDLAHLARGTILIVRQSAEVKGLTLRADISSKLSRHMSGDDNRIRQILLNLLSNAIKFTQEGSVTLTLDCVPGSPEGDFITFVVADSGIGVSEQDRPNLFRSFSQANSAISGDYGGTGLGLAISKQLVGLMGGQLGYRPREGGGSEFWFSIQLKPVDEVQVRDTPAAHLKPDAQCILVVEDVAANQELAMAMLSRDGHEVTIAANGREALSVVQSRDFDLILMDVQMPLMDGITATKLIRLLPGKARKTPIIALTANILPEQIEAFEKAGMNDHVGKPMILSELRQAIARNASKRTGNDLISTTSETMPSQSFDRCVYNNLATLLPADRLKAHSESLQNAMLSLEKFAGSTEDLKCAAHSMISQAGMFGFSGLSSLCRELEEKAGRGLPVDDVMTAIRSESAVARTKLSESPDELRRCA